MRAAGDVLKGMSKKHRRGDQEKGRDKHRKSEGWPTQGAAPALRRKNGAGGAEAQRLVVIWEAGAACLHPHEARVPERSAGLT